MKTYARLFQMAIAALSLSLLSAGKMPEVNKEFVKFGDNLFAARHEVTNQEYREFLLDLISTKQADNYLKCIYDSTQWTRKFSNSNQQQHPIIYHSHPAYNRFPIVNITMEGASAYCRWLTDRYNNDEKRTYKKVLFRLPTEREWEKICCPLPGYKLPWPRADKNGKTFLANIKVKDSLTGKDNYLIDGGLTTLRVGHYKPNKLGIYDVIGNVSELTSDGKQKGGSWDDCIDDCKVDKTQSYSLPDPRVGFRVIMEIKEK
ncbi:MAG: SUMF1/EgtB/PvdO family nonheme iron enzyme [Bacteroidota bacterium]